MLARLLALLLMLPAIASANSLILDATTKSLELDTSAAGSVDYVVSYADNTSSAFTPGTSQGNITTATTTTIVGAPGSSTQRQIKFLTIVNRSTSVANTVTLDLDVSGTEFQLRAPVSLAPRESATLNAEGQLTIYAASGIEKVQAVDSYAIAGASYPYMKAGTAKDGTGFWMAYGKDNGIPGAYSLGSPGVNGWATDCSAADNAGDPAGATQLGANRLPDPVSGGLYLTQTPLSLTVAETAFLIDVLWYNTGLTVTTTTAQTITQGTLAARDLNGTTNGEGVQAALLATAALGNAAAVSNTTISYTNQDGTSGRTGTFQAVTGWQAPATPVIGTWMPFQLQAGDRGIRSIQSITLATTYTSGSMSLVMYRPLQTIPGPIANAGVVVSTAEAPGVRVWPNSCIWALSVGNSNASNVFGTYTITER